MPELQVSYQHTRDLVGPIDERSYRFVEHVLAPAHVSPFRVHPTDSRTFVVVHGTAGVESIGDGQSPTTMRRCAMEGWHAPEGAAYRIVNPTARPLIFIEAGTTTGPTLEAADASLLGGRAPVATCVGASPYTVTKPWGHEVWYTQNLPDARYAVKQIHMTAGHQSSLQSHARKRETNYVVDGTATVLTGMTAPPDLSAVIDISQLSRDEHQPGTGWSSPPGELHRVIAQADYTSLEVSTPELDDVIRWQDDSGRGNGRVAAEHRDPAPAGAPR